MPPTPLKPPCVLPLRVTIPAPVAPLSRQDEEIKIWGLSLSNVALKTEHVMVIICFSRGSGASLSVHEKSAEAACVHVFSE